MRLAADARRLLATRALRGFADGAVSLLLPSYLTRLGFGAFAVGALVTGTLLGSAALTLGAGLLGHRLARRRVLLGAAALMAATGIGFAASTAFVPLLVVAVVGTMNPSAGDVSLFLPTEQAALAEVVAPRDRTFAFALYNLGGALAGALGAWASALPSAIAARAGTDAAAAERVGFFGYAAIALAAAALYRTLGPSVEARARPPSAPLARSRGVVMRLAALFSLDSLGGGLVVQSMLALWLYRRFGLSTAATSTIFFVAGLLAASSQLASSWLAARIGLVRTMVYTHLPSNLLLCAAALAPTARSAIALLLARMALSQMDVPARQSYVMAVVPPEERAAASSVTNVPRSLASSVTPLAAGALLARTAFGWPLVAAGLLKATYDLLLLAQFARVRPLDED